LAENRQVLAPQHQDPVLQALAEVKAKMRPGEVILMSYGYTDYEACADLAGLVSEEFHVERPYYIDCWWAKSIRSNPL
jgi:hypothetical protein